VFDEGPPAQYDIINGWFELKTLITGYSGFVGCHLLKIFNSLDNVNLLGRSAPIKFNKHLKACISPDEDYSSILHDVSVVIHIAARVHIRNDNSTNPLDQFRDVNTHGTLNLARQAVCAGVKRFIFVSSVKVNGESTHNGQVFSNVDKANPEDPYGISKSDAEFQLKQLSEDTGLEVVIIRPPLVYGEGVKANFAALLNLVTKKIPLPFGSITGNRRSLVSVYNLVDLIEKCIHHPNAANQTFLVSDDHDLSTTEMVKLMAKVQGGKPWLLPVPVWMLKWLGKMTGKSDMISRLTDSLQVDITHTKDTLDWTPPFSVEEGFAKSVQTPKHTSQTR
jgi:UDP-glucose 4-epimerase